MYFIIIYCIVMYSLLWTGILENENTGFVLWGEFVVKLYCHLVVNSWESPSMILRFLRFEALHLPYTVIILCRYKYDC